jgi:heterodisulfide reductase subunit A-like polyferredoxin
MRYMSDALPPSLWAHTAEPADKFPALQQDVDADAAIIGGGFTGLRAALVLAEAGKTVRLLERNQPGWGASGRNGGAVNPFVTV